MTVQSFSLIPFPTLASHDISITGNIARQNHSLVLHYSLAGSLDEIIWPLPSAKPGRRDELWKTTCFEFFVAIKYQPQYWEFNMSPSGDWNVYRMDAYRRIGFRQETFIGQLQFDVEQVADAFNLSTTVDLNPICKQNASLEVGITAVVQTKGGNETYWALAHPAAQADFHRRESFILELAAQPHPVGQSDPGV